MKKRGCPSGKVWYRSHRAACRALFLIRETSRRELVPVRAYHCDLCGRWHLTNSEKRTAGYGEASGASAVL